MKIESVVYATYFDSGYLSRGLTLIDSLRANGDQSEIWVLCLDNPTERFFAKSNRQGIRAISLAELEARIPLLSSIKQERSKVEYIFSIGPTFLKHVMQNHVDADSTLVYLDADLYFFDNPKDVLDGMSGASVGIIEHRYSKRLKRKLSKYGRFNVGWVGFKNDVTGNKVLNWWAERCVEWCFDAPQNDGRYADQGYLNSFPNFEGVLILQSAGFNLAPWNTETHQLSQDRLGAVEVDGDPLTFFHFHGIRETRRWYVTSQLVYGNMGSRLLMQHVYTPYLTHLQRNAREVQANLVSTTTPPARRGKGIRGAIFTWQKRLVTVISVATGNAVRKRSLMH